MVAYSELSSRRWYFINHLSKEEKKVFAVFAKMYEVGVKMKCQEIIGPYIVDFVFPHKMLVLEIDDISHKYKEEYDYRRLEYLGSLGFDVVRVSDKYVRKNITAVKRTVQGYRTVNNWQERYKLIINRERESLKYPGQLNLL